MKEYITGIGGIFYRSKDPKKSMQWYETHFGLKCDDWGKTFAWKQYDNPAISGSTQWSVFKDETDYFGNSGQPFMINYRVRDMDELLEKLKSEGVVLVKESESHAYGKFAWVEDADGYRIELWEAVDEAFGI